MVILICGIAHTCSRKKIVRLPARTFAVLGQWSLFITILAGVIIRFSHSGRVCSGDFLGEAESTEGYMVTQGTMLAALLYLWITLFGLGVCAALVTIFLMTS